MSEKVNLHAEIAATFAKARAELDEAERRALALLEGSIDRNAGPPPDEPAWSPDWGTLQQAVTILRRSSETCVKIIRRNGLGAFTDGRWRVDIARCRAYCEGRPYPPMAGACLR